MLTVGSLFSGIGGLELGLERAGMKTIWQVEKNEFCQQILDKHWPEVPTYGDITTIDFRELERPDVICGGFPCQDISLAGKGAGIEGERSGLWWEMHRAVRTLRPRYLIAENVPALNARGLDTVLGSLAEIRYDAEWTIVSAAAMGAPHIRERMFIVAYPNDSRCRPGDGEGRQQSVSDEFGVVQDDARRGRVKCPGLGKPSEVFSDTDRQRKPQPQGVKPYGGRRACHSSQTTSGPPPKPDNKPSLQTGSPAESIREEGRSWNSTLWRGRHPESRSSDGVPEPTIRRSDDGIPRRVDRLRALGNAVVPQVAEFVGHHVMRHYHESNH